MVRIGWPRVIGFAALAGLAAGTACAPAVGQRPARAGMGAKAGQGKIKLYADSHVCITSAMDVTFWSENPAAWETGKEAGASLSGVLQRKLEDSLSKKYGIDYRRLGVFLPMRTPNDSMCSRPNDVNIFFEYRKRENGEPFSFIYSIKQRSTVLEGGINRDIKGEIRSGSLTIWEMGGLNQVILDDLSSRVSLFEDNIDSAKN